MDVEGIRKFKGIFVSALTPFDENFEVDYKQVKCYTDFVIEKGVHGIVSCGINGEFSSMSMAERKKVIKTTIDAAKERVPVIAGAYNCSYKESIELANFAEEVGAAGVILTTPYFFRKPSDIGLFNYFSEVLSQVKKIPVILCNVPIYALIAIKTNLIENLIAKHKNVVGIKDLSGNPETIREYAGTFENLSVFVASDQMAFHGLNVGSDGIVSAIASTFPEYLLKIYDHHSKREIDQAWIEQESLTGIRSLMKRFPSRSAQKFILSKFCGKESFVRPPLRNLTEEEKENLVLILQEHGLLMEKPIPI
ncbi:MAG: dihydrodipicolinate synthase family protein [Candidatus Heimdallarchaeota archaeon]